MSGEEGIVPDVELELDVGRLRNKSRQLGHHLWEKWQGWETLWESPIKISADS